MGGLFSKLFGSSAQKTEAVKAPVIKLASVPKLSLFEIGKGDNLAAIDKEMSHFGCLYGGAPEGLIKGAIEALRNGKPENIQAVLSGNADVENYVSSLVHAVVYGLTADEVKTAISPLSDDEKKDALTRSLFHCLKKPFLAKEAQNIFQTLMGAGADITARKNRALQIAAKNGLTGMCEFISQNGGNYEEAIADARASNCTETVAALVTMQIKTDNDILRTENAALKAENTTLKSQLAPKGPPYTT